MNNHVIQRVPVVSSCIASFGYLETMLTLEIEYRSGAVYRYFFVPANVHAALMAAPSKGGFLNHHIRGRYPEMLIGAASAPSCGTRLPARPVARSPWFDPLEGARAGRRPDPPST
jgi:hypothetical protein